ncbi:MAG: CBS and ACT domain-containing protein [Desulfobacterales bacterium]|nr:CBS and ACT domain-containing protein [Desulfobacterales bacterium]MDD4071088.1 CBS and ACT domain-containing protein [Desulfobacterales bacterium]MDD4392143.1 CBS and ACT domain-containing protein [Desulfobacterales bacterium]
MKIRSLMISDPITVTEKATITDAMEVMKNHSIRHLPVVGEGNVLIGFLTLSDLKQGLIPSLLGEVSLADLMIKNPIEVGPDDDIELAAQLLYKFKIGGMPVVENRKLVGIITESDILMTFIEMMGILTSSSRIDVVINDEPGALEKALQIIHGSGGEIISIGQISRETGKKIFFFRLAPCKTHQIVQTLEQQGFEIVDTMG